MAEHFSYKEKGVGSSPTVPTMDIKQLIQLQLDSDKNLGFKNNRPHNLDDLAYSTIGITGELGEFADLVKKKLRLEKYGKERTDEKRKEFELKMKEELVDVFIYLMKLAAILEMDIEKEYLRKNRAVRKRYPSAKS